MLIECVPNVSEGKNQETINLLAETISSPGEAFLLDIHSDSDHNRTVFTFAGSFDGVVTAAFELTRKAGDLVDISRHEGVHPRMGAVDVCPFVPLGSTRMEEAVKAARKLGAMVAKELNIPVFLYGEAALKPERKALPKIRKFNFEELKHEIKENPDRAPDLGPKELHPTFGAIAIGARYPLVAYNIDLNSKDISTARKIASELREKNSGLTGVRALGFPLESRGKTQASFNLTESDKTTPVEVFNAAGKLASKDNIEINRSELVGLIPKNTVYKSFSQAVKLEGFGPAQVLEEGISKALPLTSYLDSVANPGGGPGGGAVSADIGAVGASLIAFVIGTAQGRGELFSKLQQLSLSFQLLSKKDQDVYRRFSESRKLPTGQKRKKAVTASLKAACETPIQIMETVLKTLELAEEIKAKGSILSDLSVSGKILLVSAESACEILNVNLKAKAASGFATEFKKRAEKILRVIKEKTNYLRGHAKM